MSGKNGGGVGKVSVGLGDSEVQERIRKHMDEQRARARVSGGFLKPVETQVGRWQISLKFGTTEEMEKLEGVEAMERERLKLPPREKRGRPRPTWHLAAYLVNTIDVEAIDFAELGMIAMGAGVPKSVISKPIEATHGTTKVYQWQWHD